MAPQVVELCAGGGGQALGLERAGFEHQAALEIDPFSCETLRLNRPAWKVVQRDIRDINADELKGIDLLSAGLPCPPFSVAGKQLGSNDERDLFPYALRLVEESRPLALMIENVRGLLAARFDDYRFSVLSTLRKSGYRGDWKLLDASDYGVSQYRRRAILVALRSEISHRFEWPWPIQKVPPTVGERIYDQISSMGWPLAEQWRGVANGLAPTIVGGSHKHGGPDLGPTRARRAWAALGVDGRGIADVPPGPCHGEMPRLTIPMVARIQGFPDEWTFQGNKTSAYKQVGNAFPPPVAQAVGGAIISALTGAKIIRQLSWNNFL